MKRQRLAEPLIGEYSTINDLVKELNLHSTTIQGGAKQIQDIITQVLLSAVNDSQRIAHD